MNRRESAICARLKSFREAMKWPVAALAQALDASEHKLTSIEHGRTPLKCIDAILISEIFDLNLDWLVTGRGEKLGGQAILWVLDGGENPYGNRLLSEVYDSCPDLFLPHDASANVNFSALSPTPNFDPVGYLQKWVPVWFNGANFKTTFDAERLARKVEAYIHSTLAKYRQAGIATRVKISRHRSSMSAIPLRASDASHLAAKTTLDAITDVGNNADVKSKLPTLLARLNNATRDRGMKSALAKYMGVPLPNVSQWLSGEREPSGETTLQLLNWVERQERKK